jgi:SAM-dependent methyltransferase
VRKQISATNAGNALMVKLRRQCFATQIPLDDRLVELARDTPSHFFLTNPASHNSYLFLLQYLKVFSECQLQKKSCCLRILDWGCGKGHCTYLLRNLGFKVVSCDIERSADDSAFGQETPIIAAESIDVIPLEDAVKLPFESESFDIVLSMGVLEHVKNDSESLREINRILRPRGLFFCFFLPFVGSWTQYVMRSRGDNYHDRLYTKSKVKSLLKESGFELQDFWHRQLFPKNSVRYPMYHLFESLDQALVRFTPLRYLATNIEFVASRSKINLI